MRKDIEVDYTKDEFIKKYDIRKTDFKNDIEPFLNYFGINKKQLKRDSNEEGNYEIPYEISDLLALMFRNFKYSPFYDKRYNLTTKDTTLTLDYIDKILSEIETLPDYLKYNIKKNPSYLFNLNLNELIPILIDKFTTLFVLIGSKSSVSAGNQLTELIKQLDNWIDDYCQHDQLLEANKNPNIPILDIDDIGNLHSHNKYGYNIDSVLSKCLNDNLREQTTNLPYNIPDSLKDKIFNLTNNSSKNTEPSEDELIQLRNEYNKFLNALIDKKHLDKIINDINACKNISDSSSICPKYSISKIEKILCYHFTSYNIINSDNFHTNEINMAQTYTFKLDNLDLINYLNRMVSAHKKDIEYLRENYSIENLTLDTNLQEELKKCASEIFNLQKNIYVQKEALFKEIHSNPQYKLIKQLLNNQLAQILFLSMK